MLRAQHPSKCINCFDIIVEKVVTWTLQVSLFNRKNMRHEYKFPLKDLMSLEQDEEKMTIILKDDTIFYLSHKDFIFKGIGKFLLAIPKKVK